MRRFLAWRPVWCVRCRVRGVDTGRLVVPLGLAGVVVATLVVAGASARVTGRSAKSLLAHPAACATNGCSPSSACASPSRTRLTAMDRFSGGPAAARSAAVGAGVGWTPARKTALVVAPFAFQPEFGNDSFRPAVAALRSEGYSVTVLENSTLSDAPAVTVAKFIRDARLAGVIFFFGHASRGILPLEVYRTKAAWLQRAKQVESQPAHWPQMGYVNGAPVDSGANLLVGRFFPTVSYGYGLTPKGIANLVRPLDHPFVWLTACYGASFRRGFQHAGARSFYGYVPEIYASAAVPDVTRFWDGLVGPLAVDSSAGTPNTRLTDGAHSACQAAGGCQDTELWSLNGPMTLAPAVASIEPDPQTSPSVPLHRRFKVKVGFDAHMDQAPADDVVKVSGCGVKPAPGSKLAWSGDHTIDGEFEADAGGDLKITVVAKRAVSAGGKIELDGNESGNDGLTGGAPHGDDFVWHESCAGAVIATYSGTVNTDTVTYPLFSDNLNQSVQGTFTGKMKWSEQVEVRGNSSGGVVVGAPTLTIQNGTINFTTNPPDPSLNCSATLSAGPGSPTALPEPSGPELRTSLNLTWDTATKEVGLYAAIPAVPPLVLSSAGANSQCAHLIHLGPQDEEPWPGSVKLKANQLPWSQPYTLAYSTSGEVSATINVTSTLSVAAAP